MSIFKLLGIIIGVLIIIIILKELLRWYYRRQYLKKRESFLASESRMAILRSIHDALDTYHNMAIILHSIFVCLGFIAILSSVFVTTFVAIKQPEDIIFYGNVNLDNILPWVSFSSTTALTLITAFNLGNKANGCRKAWRVLNHKLEQYQAGAINMTELLKAHDEAEAIIGGVDFQYTV